MEGIEGIILLCIGPTNIGNVIQSRKHIVLQICRGCLGKADMDKDFAILHICLRANGVTSGVEDGKLLSIGAV